ncbi:MAG TPA: bifunctional 4-hydroxy-2-oxoglutarate aldolase/2-dehydro-3-deoxy-phosphogluconate aldolase [Acidobacteriota bacterium]
MKSISHNRQPPPECVRLPFVQSSEILTRILKERLVAIVRAESADIAAEAAQAAFQGGLSVLEVTFTVPEAERAIECLRMKLPHAAIGAGSILSAEQARKALGAGAQFLISPHCDPKLFAWAHRQNVLYTPAGFTPSELMSAWNAGFPLVKFYPASAGGPDLLKSLLQPLPFLRLMATGGIDKSNAVDFLRAGAAALGVGGSVFRSSFLRRRDWNAVQSAGAELVQACAGT